MVVSAFFNLILITLLIILGVLFISGMILLIAGVRKNRKPENKGKKSPKVMIAFGIILIIPAVMALSIGVFVKTFSFVSDNTWKARYDSVAEMWKNKHVNEKKACEQAFEELLKAADEGDKEAFSKCFSDTIRKEPDFQERVDNFFKSYPGELKDLEYDDGGADSSASLNHGHNVKLASNRYDAIKGSESYYISLRCCFENTDNPEEIGVTQFIVMNLGGYADYCYDSFGYIKHPEEDEYLLCYMKSPEEVPARRIGGTAYPWTASEKEPVTKEEMKKLLVNNEYFCDAKSSGNLGEPNVTYSIVSSNGDNYIYELASENGKPLYVDITVNYEDRIVDAITRGQEKSDGHEWLVDNTPRLKKEKEEKEDKDQPEDD